MADFPGITVIPESPTTPWRVALQVSWSALRRRFLRVLITMTGVILAIAFLAYMLIVDRLTKAMIALRDDDLNRLLQRAGVDILAGDAPDRMMYLLIGLSLMICLVGIVNAMLMSVTERVKEIGTLKCLGATDGFIVRTYFIEALLQGVLGTCLGLALGLVVAVGVAWASYGSFVVQAWPWGAIANAMGMTLGIGTMISIGAAIGPAYAAARKQPIEALRVEE